MDTCSSCGNTIESTASACPHCGTPLGDPTQEAEASTRGTEPDGAIRVDETFGTTGATSNAPGSTASATAGRGWTVLGEGRTSKAETAVGLGGVVTAIGVFLPWFEVSYDGMSQSIPGRVSGTVAPPGSYAGYETLGGLIVLGLALGVLALSWYRRWDGWSAVASALAGTGIFLGVAGQSAVTHYSHSIGGQVIAELPDGTYAPIEAVDLGLGGELGLFSAVLMVIASLATIGSVLLDRIRAK